MVVSPFGLFLQRAESRELRVIQSFFWGAYAPVAMIVSPFGAFFQREREKRKEVGAYIFRGAYATIAIFVSPYGLFCKDCFLKSHKSFSSCSSQTYLFFSRGLRHHRYDCVALTDFNVSKPSKPSQPSKPYFSRGLGHHRYDCVALRAFIWYKP